MDLPEVWSESSLEAGGRGEWWGRGPPAADHHPTRVPAAAVTSQGCVTSPMVPQGWLPTRLLGEVLLGQWQRTGLFLSFGS